MPDAPTLESLARECFPFPPLTEAEIKLVRSIPSRGYIYIGPSSNEDDPTNDPSKADSWGSDRQIRGELIRWLCVDHRATTLFDPAGIVIMGARIIGEIDLLYVPIPFPLTFNRCKLENQLILNNATLPSLNLSGSTVTFIRADGAVIKGGVLLRKGFCALGGVRMVGTEIGSTLDLSNATLMSEPNPASSEVGMALRADRLVVKASVYMDEKFRAEGAVSFLGAQIGGELQCAQCSFENPFRKGITNSGTAFFGNDMKIGGNVTLRDGFRCVGQIQLLNAQIGGGLTCAKATLTNSHDPHSEGAGMVLVAGGLVVEGSVHLNGQFEGGILLKSAKIGGDLDCRTVTIKNPSIPGIDLSGVAILADAADISGNLFLRDGFRAEGMVKLTAIRIGLDLGCRNATLWNPCYPGVETSGRALNADGAVIAGSVWLRPGVHAFGDVGMLGIQIGRDLDCEGARILNLSVAGAPQPSGYALSADGAVVKGAVLLRYGFHAEGEVRLLNAEIGRYLDFIAAELGSPSKFGGSTVAVRADRIQVNGDILFGQILAGPSSQPQNRGSCVVGDALFNGAQIGGNLSCEGSRFDGTLSAERASIKGRLYWIRIVNPEQAALELRDASIGAIVDDANSWPMKGKLHVDGLTYQRFSGSPKDASGRLEWLGRIASFSFQPYRHLANVLGDSGDNVGSRKVLFEMERRRRKDEDRTSFQKLWGGALRRTVGYGYHPGRALWWLAGLVILGWGIYWGGFCAGSMVPTDKDAYAIFRATRTVTAQHDRFHALVYSAENSFPLAKFGEVERWEPDPNAKRHTYHFATWSPCFPSWVSLAGLLLWFRWAQILSGWFLATMGLAAITGIVRKD